MNKIRVLQFPIRNTAGGITQYALKNWEYIDKTNYQFDFATFDNKLDFENELTGQYCKVHYFSCYAEDNIKQFTAELNEILDIGYDAVHLHTSYWKSFIVEEAAKARNIPVIIVHSHNSELGGADSTINREDAIIWHKRQRDNFNESLATHFFACSQNSAKWLFGPQIPKESIKILNNAIDVKKFKYTPRIRMHYRDKLGFHDNYIIGHVGRFEYQKNHEFLINVFYNVSKQIKNARLVLVGIGSNMNEVKEKVHRLGLSEKVQFLGKRADVAELYQAIDLFVLPSLFEGLPISMIEAQCSGLKCLTSDNVTEEVKITDCVKHLPLRSEVWRDEIIKTAISNYERYDQSAEVTAKGFSISDQIKTLERIYAREETIIR